MKPTPFGVLLKRYRMAAGLTQEALASVHAPSATWSGVSAVHRTMTRSTC
jgi:hypothetical protein